MTARKLTYIRGMGGVPADALGYFEAASTPGDLRGSAAGFQAHLLFSPHRLVDGRNHFLAGCYDADVGSESGYQFVYDGTGAHIVRLQFGTGASSFTLDISLTTNLQALDYLLSFYFDPTFPLVIATSLYINGTRTVTGPMGFSPQPAAAPVQFSIGGHDPAVTQETADGAQENLVSAFAQAGLFPGVANLDDLDDAMIKFFRRVRTAEDIPQEFGLGADPQHLYSAAQSLRNLEDGVAATWEDRGTAADTPLTRVGDSLTGQSVEASWYNWQSINVQAT